MQLYQQNFMFNRVPEITSEINHCTYDEYVDKFAELIEDEFTYSESENHYGLIKTNIYTHRFEFNSHTSMFSICGEIRTPKFLLGSWIKHYIGPCYFDEHMKFAYKYVELKDLLIYIEMIKISYIFGINCRKDLPYRLMLIYKKIQNLSHYQFVIEYREFFYNSGFSNYIMIEEFEEEIKEINNKKISELWWIWKDYSGIYSNYIEWLPRELVEDTIMVQHFGEYQPDYTTYVQ